MWNLENLEKELKKQNIIAIIKDTFSTGIDEMSRTLSKIFSTPKSWDNQITKELEQFEEELINQKK